MAMSQRARALGRRHRPRRRFRPGEIAQPKQTTPQLARAVYPRCGTASSTRYRYCFLICHCGWMLKVEPMSKYGHVGNDYWPISVDDLRRVAPAGWEEAAKWPSHGDLIRRHCKKCNAITPQVKRASGNPDLSSLGLMVSTCVHCDYAHPDPDESSAAILEAVEDWQKRGLCKVELGDDGKARGVRMPSHEDVLDERELKQLQKWEQDIRG